MPRSSGSGSKETPAAPRRRTVRAFAVFFGRGADFALAGFARRATLFLAAFAVFFFGRPLRGRAPSREWRMIGFRRDVRAFLPAERLRFFMIASSDPSYRRPHGRKQARIKRRR
jgi:hypothetical protein